MATLFAALVRALDQSHPGVATAFCAQLEAAHRSEKERASASLAVLETLQWTDDLVRVPRDG